VCGLGQGGQEARYADDLEDAFQVVSEDGETELPPHPGEAFEEEMPLVHSAFHGTEWGHCQLNAGRRELGQSLPIAVVIFRCL
jgi:hypothetical protein